MVANPSVVARQRTRRPERESLGEVTWVGESGHTQQKYRPSQVEAARSGAESGRHVERAGLEVGRPGRVDARRVRGPGVVLRVHVRRRRAAQEALLLRDLSSVCR